MRPEKVRPTLRFRIRRNRKLVESAESFVLYGKSCFYYCPHCNHKTLVDWKKLTVWPSTRTWPYESPPSPFSAEELGWFGEIPERSLAYDFYCTHCRAPVRLLFWIEERYGMGGPWFPEIKWVIECQDWDVSNAGDSPE